MFVLDTLPASVGQDLRLPFPSSRPIQGRRYLYLVDTGTQVITKSVWYATSIRATRSTSSFSRPAGPPCAQRFQQLLISKLVTPWIPWARVLVDRTQRQCSPNDAEFCKMPSSADSVFSDARRLREEWRQWQSRRLFLDSLQTQQIIWAWKSALASK